MFVAVNEEEGMLFSPSFEFFSIEFPLIDQIEVIEDGGLYFDTAEEAEQMCARVTVPEFKVVKVK